MKQVEDKSNGTIVQSKLTKRSRGKKPNEEDDSVSTWRNGDFHHQLAIFFFFPIADDLLYYNTNKEGETVEILKKRTSLHSSEVMYCGGYYNIVYRRTKNDYYSLE